MTSASAPGKIILFGEHAVVYGRPALAVPVTHVHADAEVREGEGSGIRIEATDIGLKTALADMPPHHPLAAAARAVLERAGAAGREAAAAAGLHIKVTSSIPSASGLGSGTAVSVALIRALAMHLGLALSDEDVSEMAFEVDKLYHGTPSGIDNTVVTYAQPVYFVRGQPMERLRVSGELTMVIGDTGVRAPTKEAVGDVRSLWEADKQRWEKVFDEVGEIVRRARVELEGGRGEALGALMNENHARLQEMTVSSRKLDRLAEAARAAGAWGAKMSGGGRGGSMIALTDEARAEAVSRGLKAAKARGVIISRLA